MTNDPLPDHVEQYLRETVKPGTTRDPGAIVCSICGKLLGCDNSITNTGMSEYGTVHTSCLVAELDKS